MKNKSSRLSKKKKSKSYKKEKSKSYKKYKGGVLSASATEFTLGMRGESSSNKNKSDINIQSAFRKKSDAAKKIQSLTRGRQSRKNTDWKKRDGLRFPLEVQKKIFFESVFGDDIIDRQNSLEELQKTLLRKQISSINDYKNMIRNSNYEKLEDTGLFKPKSGNYTGLDIDPDQEINSDDSDIVQKRYLKDWYETTLDKINLEGDTKQIKLGLDEKMKHIEGLEDLDMFKCKRMKKILDADPAMYADPQITRYSDQCRNDLTRIFVDTFYKLQWDLIMPFLDYRDYIPPSEQSEPWAHYDVGKLSVQSKINSYPNDKFTTGAKSALIDTLLDLDLIVIPSLLQNVDAVRRRDQRARQGLRVGADSTHDTRFDQLANYFFYSKEQPLGGRQHQLQQQRLILRHLPGQPSITFKTDGRTSLNAVLDLFEETVLSRNIRDKSPEKIERMKRYFIYSLIGLDSIPHYQDKLSQKIISVTGGIQVTHTDIEYYLNNIELPDMSLRTEQSLKKQQIEEQVKAILKKYKKNLDTDMHPRIVLIRKLLAKLKKYENNLNNYNEMNEYIINFIM